MTSNAYRAVFRRYANATSTKAVVRFLNDSNKAQEYIAEVALPTTQTLTAEDRVLVVTETNSSLYIITAKFRS